MLAPKTVVEGLRGVGRVELEFEQGRSVYVLLGRNAVGKTKTLEALFQIAFCACVTTLDEYSRKLVSRDLLVFEVAGGDEWTLGLPSSAPPFLPGIEGVTPEPPLPAVFVGSQSRGFVRAERKEAGPLGTASQRRDLYIESVLSGMKSDFTSLNMAGEIQLWFVTRAQSGNRYQKEEDSREIEIETVLGLINRIDDRIDPSFLEIAGDERVSVKVDGQIRQLDQLSSGFASLLKIVQTVVSGYASFTNGRSLDQVRGMVFIDEVESHLHLSWQARIVRLLVELFPNTTFFVTTHSALVTAQCRRGEVYTLSRDQEDGVVRSSLVKSPGTAAMADLLDDVFDVDVNALKLDRMSAENQREAKAALLEMIREERGE